MSPFYEIECPNYTTGCDIENCPRLLDNIDVTLGKDGELVGSGFCTAKGGRFFGGISHEKIKVLAGKWQGAETEAKTCSRTPLFTPEYELEIKQTLKLDSIDDLAKFDREKISQLPLPDDKHTTALMAATEYRLRNAPEAKWSTAFTDRETAESAIFLYGIRREVDKGGTKFDRLHCILDSRKDYDGLRFRKLVLDLIDAFFDVFDAADFYSGLRQIGFYETPAARIMEHTHALIRILDEATNEPGRFYHGFKLSQLDPSILPLVIHALLSFLDSICHKNLFAKEFDIKELETNLGWSPDLEANEDDKIYFHRTLADVSLTLKELLTELRIREHEVYDLHPEWEIVVGEYNMSQDRQNQSRALHAYCEKHVDRNGVNPVRHFVEMTNFLNSGEAHITDYLTWLKNLLETPPAYSYESKVAAIESADQDSEITAQINPWIVDAKKSMIEALRAFCDRRANALSPEGKARELWLLVNAKIRLASHGVETEAKAIVDTIKQAAERELVEGCVKAKTNEEDDAPIPESDWKKWPKRPPRFRCDAACANVVDYVHTNNPKYREIRHYTNMPVSAQKAIRLLLAAASKNCEDDWWIPGQDEDGKPFIQAFQSKANKAARRFYNEQIEVGGSVGEHKGKWRILPETMFDDNYRDKHPSADALSGS